jgi:hypothetical protein
MPGQLSQKSLERDAVQRVVGGSHQPRKGKKPAMESREKRPGEPASTDPWPTFGVRMEMKNIAAALALVGSVIWLPGCSTFPDDAAVAVSLVSIRPLHTSLFETSAELTLRFTNESLRPLILAGSTHRLYLNGTYVGRAITNERLAVPQLGTMTQTVPAHLENLALMKKAQELGKVSTVDYRIDSRLHAADEQGGGTRVATATGQLDFSGLLPAPAPQS